MTRNEISEHVGSLTSWLSNPNIHLITVANKLRGGVPTGELAISVGVLRKKALGDLDASDFHIPEMVATGVGSIATDVVEIDYARPYAGRDRKARPCPAGFKVTPDILIAGRGYPSGTLGFNYSYKGAFSMVSANHAIAWNQVNTNVYQPDVDETRLLCQVKGCELLNFYDTEQEPNPTLTYHDVAWCDTDEDRGAPRLPVGNGRTVPISGLGTATLSESVRYAGFTTDGVYAGTVTDLNALSKMPFVMPTGRTQYVYFSRLVAITPPQAKSGDSGAAIFNDSNVIVGILIGGATDGKGGGYDLACALP
jgi:hypothetical protein